MVILFSVTVFTSAALLFVVQPMFARMVLPVLGGAPAVWNTAMVFFQAVLLLGYTYAHTISSRLTLRRQLWVHVIVFVGAASTLPMAISTAGLEQGSGPVTWLFQAMAGSVALPFLALSTTNPLLQTWFAASRHPRAGDPYFLSAFSNAGSLTGLLAYPLFVEPHLTLRQQNLGWAMACGFLVVLLGACAVAAWKLRRPVAESSVAPSEQVSSHVSVGAGSWRERGAWVLLAFVPSSLMLGVTTFISSEVAAVPLLWVVPLAIYLVTYVIAFARREVVSPATLLRVLPLLVVVVVVFLNMRATQPIGLLMGIHLLAFAVAAQLCHSTLAAARPAATRATEFYFWMCVGGVLGGLFNALLAPAVFDGVIEYPVALVAASLVARSGLRGGDSVRSYWIDLASAAGVFALAVALMQLDLAVGTESVAMHTLAFGLPAVICYLFSRRRWRFGLCVAALLAAAAFNRAGRGEVLHAERSFFGVHRVTVDPTGRFHMLFHGSTLHGMQYLDPARRREALTYYHASGPAGQVLAALGQSPDAHIGAVGLGAGSLATYAKPGQTWTYFEIDPVVVEVASDPRYFTFLRDAAVPVAIRLGDARLTLQNEREASFDVLLVDAYSSDAVPVHLVTREALALYLSKLKLGGCLAFHISNLHLDLEPLFANLAEDAGLVSRTRDDTNLAQSGPDDGKTASVWLVMARRPEDLGPLARDPRWTVSRTDPALAVWTDDYSSIWGVFRWE